MLMLLYGTWHKRLVGASSTKYPQIVLDLTLMLFYRSTSGWLVL